MRLILTFFLTLLFISVTSHSVCAQNLNGKWILEIKKKGRGNGFNANLQILKFKGKVVTSYSNLEQTQVSTVYKYKKGKLFADWGEYGRLRSIDKNHFVLDVDATIDGMKTVVMLNYYRLRPTKTALEKKEIEELVFLVNENGAGGENSEIAFTKGIKDSIKLKLQQDSSSEKKFFLDKMDQTFFVTIISRKKQYSFPIMEITTSFLKLYAIPNPDRSQEMIAYRKE